MKLFHVVQLHLGWKVPRFNSLVNPFSFGNFIEYTWAYLGFPRKSDRANERSYLLWLLGICFREAGRERILCEAQG